jgi:hypothetical protein
LDSIRLGLVGLIELGIEPEHIWSLRDKISEQVGLACLIRAGREKQGGDFKLEFEHTWSLRDKAILN